MSHTLIIHKKRTHLCRWCSYFVRIHLELSQRDTADMKPPDCIFSETQRWHDQCGACFGIGLSELNLLISLEKLPVDKQQGVGASRVKLRWVIRLKYNQDHFHSCTSTVASMFPRIVPAVWGPHEGKPQLFVGRNLVKTVTVCFSVL